MKTVKFFAVAVLALLAGCATGPAYQTSSSDVRWLKDGGGSIVCESAGQILPKEDCLKIAPEGLAKNSAQSSTRAVVCVENFADAMFGGFFRKNHNGRGRMIARVITPGDGPSYALLEDCSPKTKPPTVFDKADPYDEWGERQRQFERNRNY
ncbi:MAG: hypothetical protein AAB471_01975 [Patescibacteria group bacterium]